MYFLGRSVRRGFLPKCLKHNTYVTFLTVLRMPMMMKLSKSEPEVEIQYGGHLFLETGSSYISAVN